MSTTTTTEMSDYDQANARFADLRQSAGLGTAGEYEVRSCSTITGAYNVVGRTDDVSLACAAARQLAASHAVPCETFEAHVSLRRLA